MLLTNTDYWIHCLRTRRPRRRRRQARHETKRLGLPNIARRPGVGKKRGELGHWHRDQIIGKSNRSSMLWLTERVTSSIPVAMPCGYAGEAMLAGLVEGLEAWRVGASQRVLTESWRTSTIMTRHSIRVTVHRKRMGRLVVRSKPEGIVTSPSRQPCAVVSVEISATAVIHVAAGAADVPEHILRVPGAC